MFRTTLTGLSEGSSFSVSEPELSFRMIPPKSAIKSFCMDSEIVSMPGSLLPSLRHGSDKRGEG